jgi:hypothetical protein
MTLLLMWPSVKIQPIQEQQVAHQPRANASDTRNNEQPSKTTAAPSSPYRQETINNDSRDKTWDWHDAFAPPNWPNWALVAVGIGAIIAAICTLRGINGQAAIMRAQTQAIRRQGVSMRRQTTLLRQSSRAAVRSADAAIASERAWVMVDLQPKGGPGFLTDVNSNKGRQLAASVSIICTNHGKTPARIIRKEIRLVVWNLVNPLPQNPDLDHLEVFDSTPHYLSPGKPYVRDWECVGDNPEGNVDMTLIYGVVKYRHIFSNSIVQTTFCYWVTPPNGLELLGEYPEYNKNT